MQKPKREIVLFCEENEFVDNISSNLVRLYMNRLAIEEEEQLEIIGNFNLTQVAACFQETPKKLFKANSLMSSIEPLKVKLRKRHIDRLFEVNWYKDKAIIEKALDELQVFNKRHIETHIIIGSSLYFDHLENSFNKLISNWNNKLLKANGPTYGIYEPFNQLTLLNGWRRATSCTKNQVKRAYQKDYHINKAKSHQQNTSSLSPNLVMMSVNDDLERIIARSFRPVYTRQEYIKTFLYKMQEDEVFSRSDCERLTVALY